MTLLAPLGLIFLISIPVVVLFYLLRVRLREFEVSSTYLWAHLLRDLSAQDPWQKPRFTALMAIQILFLALLTLALARPAWLASAEESVLQVVILDTAASMQATDLAPSRFALAQRLAADAIRQLPAGSRVAVIAAGSRPEILVPSTGDPEAALAAVENARPGSTPLDLPATLRLAGAIAAGHRNGRVTVFGDGAFEQPASLPESGSPPRFQLVGGGSNNQAITDVAARPDPQNARRFQVFVRVRNFAPEPIQTTLGLYADGGLIEGRGLTLSPDGNQELVFDRLPENASVIEARLLDGDDLAADNAVATVLQRRNPTRVLLVSPGNVFLERGLTALPNVDVFRTTPPRYSGIDVEKYDVIAFDGYLPEALPRQNLLIVNPPDSPLLPVEGHVDRPTISTWERENPLLRYVSLSDVRFLRAAKVAAPGWAKVVVAADSDPLLLAGELRRQRVVALAFDLQQSNLPLSAGFPILIANAVGYLEPAGALSEQTITAGAGLTIQPLPQADEVIVERPDGSAVTFSAGKPFVYDQTEQIGLYTVQQRTRGEVVSRERFAVNLANESASDIRPRFTPAIEEQPEEGPSGPATTQRQLWPWLALAGLMILTGEWWWYHRRA